MWQVWMRAGHDMCDSWYGGILFGTSDAPTWEEACIEVMEPRGDSYWHRERPTIYWGTELCKSEQEAFEHFDPKHPSHPNNRR